MDEKEYNVEFFDNDHELKNNSEKPIKANAPCHAVEIWVDIYGFPSSGYAKVTCENGLTFTFDVD